MSVRTTGGPALAVATVSLPYTGIDLWVIAVLGLVLLLAGLAIYERGRRK